MKNQLRSYVTSAMLLLPAAIAVVAVPTSAMAQPATPEVSSLDIAADAGLQPGSRFTLRLVGTQRVQASVRISGVRDSIALRETAPGVYVGRYTLKRTDRVGPDSETRAVLRRGNRIGSETFSLSETLNAAPVAVAPPPQPQPVPAPPALRIERFGMVPIERIEAGAELRLVLEGLAGGTATVDVPGVVSDLRLQETRPGRYEGNYTIRRADTINPNRPLVATLRSGDRAVSANLPIALAQTATPVPAPDNKPPLVENIRPRDGETVPAGTPVSIGANFDDRGGSGVDPASVRIAVSGRNVTPDAQISSQSFSYRDTLPAGRHSVEVTARDRAGNVVRTGWSFDVAAAPAHLPIQVLNHGNNAQVGNGPTLVQGRTVPNALVAVTVNAVAPVGGLFDVSQELFSQNVQADPNGNFSFSFVPQYPVAGTRYDVSMVATRGNYRDDAKLVLVQR